MKLFDAQLQALKQQIEAAPWLKWAALVIAALLAVFALQTLNDWRIARQKASVDTEQALRRTLALKGQDAWLAREKSALQLRDSLAAQLPQVATPGMAQATLQSWLRGMTGKFDGKQNATIRINRSAPVDGMPNVLRVNAALNGNFDPRQALTLLRQIENRPNLVVVETINLQNDGSNTLHMTLNAYYRVPGETAP